MPPVFRFSLYQSEKNLVLLAALNVTVTLIIRYLILITHLLDLAEVSLDKYLLASGIIGSLLLQKSSLQETFDICLRQDSSTFPVSAPTGHWPWSAPTLRGSAISRVCQIFFLAAFNKQQESMTPVGDSQGGGAAGRLEPPFSGLDKYHTFLHPWLFIINTTTPQCCRASAIFRHDPLPNSCYPPPQ